MSHGDVGAKNTIMQFLLHFYRRIICSPPTDLVPTEIVLPNTHKQGDGKTESESRLSNLLKFKDNGWMWSGSNLVNDGILSWHYLFGT